eukprot:CAMPEP_0118681064 /NCGR_PEP_ID=MMETSP0800-20121206/4727_1 /TAXON_ID=210618 ORGANISM="Striatella unipunctata, Strain CCMP2910" /NCGR_SAMPLE_ID=MMETSP0800 /ASSEMBLY_ACC=CAM_ASM_000638 /LENGTH=72 /DNA_ID=CAMNT_0006577311 /DNA_START=173 /DNA_END=387 /DNA_ORIENTATION=-
MAMCEAKEDDDDDETLPPDENAEEETHFEVSATTKEKVQDEMAKKWAEESPMFNPTPNSNEPPGLSLQEAGV